MAEPGTYDEDIDFKGKNLTVRSIDPHDAVVRATTVIRGCGQEPVVSFSYADYGGPPCILSGLTITDGNTGIYCSGACPTIANCNIVANRGPGIEWWTSLACRYPIVANCTVAENQGPGVLFPVRGNPSIINCVIAGNGENGIYARSPWMTNCTVVGNKLWGVTGVGGKVANCIIRDNAAGAIESSPLVSYSNIEGGCEGQGNVDVDPCFVVNGYSVPSDTADLDGDGNTTEPMPWDLDGRDRLADGDCNDTDIVDMGAYEFAYAYIGDFDGQCDVDFEDFAVFALAWLSGEGEGRYNPNCDISIPSDKFIDWRDLDVVSENWLGAL
ncbi:MAG: right-handed parallel beta-helix repeat-containing protein [Planctomycetota bacterium]